MVKLSRIENGKEVTRQVKPTQVGGMIKRGWTNAEKPKAKKSKPVAKTSEKAAD